MNQQQLRSRFQALFNPESFSYKNVYSRSIASRIFKCHTAELGYHCYHCNNSDCGHRQLQYHSCSNRHCCFCGTLKKEEWVENRINDLLPCPYYHIVFTVPHQWNRVMMQAPAQMYRILFDAASQTLLTLGQDHKYLGAVPGITSVLHTWGQKLDYHVHLHCIVSGGGVKNGKWITPKRSNGKFLFPVPALKKVYKAIFLRLLRERKSEMPVSDPQIDEAIKASGHKHWKVYAKKPFGGPEQVVKYLGRYTHKTAITYHRIKAVSDHHISFAYKDYRDNKQKEMTLTCHEFLARFERHILPYRFVRIRHYGLLQNHGKTVRLNQLREEMDWEQPAGKVEVSVAIRMLEKYGRDVTKCGKCGQGRLELLMTKRFGKVTYHRARDVPLDEVK
ncbi:MAG: IS91 family transposase [Pseudomonadota bacterium]